MQIFRCYTSQANYEKITRGSTGEYGDEIHASLSPCEKRDGMCVCTHRGNLILLSAYNTQLSPGWTETQHLPWRIRPIPRLVFHRPSACYVVRGWGRNGFTDALGLGWKWRRIHYRERVHRRFIYSRNSGRKTYIGTRNANSALFLLRRSIWQNSI